MAKKPSVITLDDSFTPEPSGSVTLDDSFSAVPLDDSFTAEPTIAPTEVPLVGGPAETTNESIFSQRLKEAQGVRPGLDPENEFGGDNFINVGGVDIPNPLKTVRDITSLGARGLEYLGAGTNTALDYIDEASRASGLADALSVGGNKFLPGSAIGALGEAFPLGGAETGLNLGTGIASRMSHNAQLAPDVEAGLSQMFKTGSVDDIVNYAKQAGRQIDPEAVAQYVAERDRGTPVSTDVQYGVNPEATQGELNLGTPAHQTEFDFNQPTLEEQLTQEAADFRRSREPEPTPEQVFARPEVQGELPFEDNIPSQREFDFGERTGEQTPILLDDTFTPSVTPLVEDVTNRVNEIKAQWKNAPETEIVNSVDDIADPQIKAAAKAEGTDKDALGFVGPDGKVRIIAGNLDKPEDVTGVLFHEALGHYGLAQKFGEDLDGMLRQFYDHSVGGFKEKVDDWLASNPDGYRNDPNRVLRAAEEVLAEQSANGQLSPAVVDRLTNYIKRMARQMGLNLKYSQREIDTILAMAHDAVVKGKGRDVVGNGFRYMYVGAKAEGHRASDIADFYDDYARTGGADPKKLREDHGFFVGPEGGIRREISDDTARLHPDWETQDEGFTSLGNILYHPELFENYPFLRDLEVVKKKAAGDWSKSVQGGYNPKTNKITITPYAKEPESTLLHEIQHVIQDYEGWAEGGNAKSAIMALTPAQRKAYKRKVLLEKRERYDRDLNEYNKMSDWVEDPKVTAAAEAYRQTGLDLEKAREANGGRLDFSDPAGQAAYDANRQAEKDMMKAAVGVDSYFDIPKEDQFAWSTFRQALAADRLDEDLARLAKNLQRDNDALQKVVKAETVDELASVSEGTNTQFQNYQNLFGEIEARDVQARQKLSAADRWDNLPYSSADNVANEDVVLSRGMQPIAAETSGNRYSRRKTREEEPERIAGVNIDNIETVNDVRKILDDLAEKNPKTTKSWKEVKQEARAMNLNPTKVAKGQGIGDTDAKITAYRDVQTNLLERVSELASKLDENYNEADAVNFAQKMSQMALVHAQVQGLQSDVARALNAMKIVSRSNKSASAILKELSENGGNLGALSDKDSLLRFARNINQMLQDGNVNGASAAAVNILKPYWEDYLLTGRHAAMLSGMGTHYKNIVENATFIGRDLQEHAAAMVGGNVTPTEVGARMYGLMRAALDSQTYRSTLDAYVKGHEPRTISGNTKVEGARIPGVSKVLDALNAEDVFFRNFLDSMNLYGLGVREAQKQGFKGIDAFQQGSHLALNPTEALRESATKAADRALLVDSPSYLTQKVENVKARKAVMTPHERTIRFAAHIMFPFARVSDRILSRMIQRSPLALFSRTFWNDVKSGDKATRDVAMSRMLMGTALIGYYAYLADKGEIEGSGPGYKKQQALEAGGYQPNSIIEDGQYKDASPLNVSFNPLDPQNAIATNVASVVQAYKRKQLDGEQAYEGIKSSLGAMMKILGSGSFAENIQPALDAYQGVTSTEENEGKSNAAAGNFLGGLASSFVPTQLRTLNTSSLDTTRRETTGDKSLEDRVAGRVMAGIPGLSNRLPVKYDLYGRPMEQGKNLTGVDNYQNIDNDPAIKEIQRLERGTEQPIVTAAPSSFQHEGETIKLDASQRSEFQRVSGTYFLESMQEVVTLPGWQTADDGFKKEVIKEVLSDARKKAKEELFFTNEEEENNDGE